MLINLDYGNANKDFDWVIRILNSAETSSQLEVVNRCFQLWEKKYTQEKLTKIERSFMGSLKSKFWATFKNKEIRLVTTFNL